MPDLTRIDQQIVKVKARLSELYAKRREVIAASKPPKRMSSDEREKQIAALALAGASMEDIIEKVKLHRTTIRHHLWHSIWDAARKELGKDASYADHEAKELELRSRLCPGIKWGKPWTAAQLEASRARGGRPLKPQYPIRYVFNDGTVKYLFADGSLHEKIPSQGHSAGE